MKKLGGCVGAGGTVGWAKTVSNQSKIGLGHWRLPRAGQSPYYFTLGHLRPAPVLPLLVLGVRVSVSQAGGVLHHRPKELHRGPLPPERAVQLAHWFLAN